MSILSSTMEFAILVEKGLFMDEEKKIIYETKDNRTEYANSVVADLEAYANKHGLFIGKKEYVEHDKWESIYREIHKVEKLQLDAILFSGIVSAINGLEYVIIYNSYNNELEFCMLRSDFRETYADGDGHITWYQGTDDDHELFFGSEYRCINKARSNLEDMYPDFGKLCRGKYSKHVSEGALDGMMAAFRECEAKHVRRQKNNANIAKKIDKIKASEDALPNILDVLAPMVGGRELFNGYDRYINESNVYPIDVHTYINTGVVGLQIDCTIMYNTKRDKFHVNIRMDDGCYDGKAYTILCGEDTDWTGEGSIDVVVNHIKFAVEMAKMYGDTAKRVKELMESMNIKSEKDDE